MDAAAIVRPCFVGPVTVPGVRRRKNKQCHDLRPATRPEKRATMAERMGYLKKGFDVFHTFSFQCFPPEVNPIVSYRCDYCISSVSRTECIVSEFSPPLAWLFDDSSLLLTRAPLGYSAERGPLGRGGGRFCPPCLTPELIGAARRARRRSKALNEKISMHIRNFL